MSGRTRGQLIAVVLLPILGLGVMAYILSNQTAAIAPSWLPFVGEHKYTVDAEFTTAQAVVPGQGQPVTIAGVRIGLVTGVRLRNGHAVVQMKLDKGRGPIYRNAHIVLRPRTPLRDMYLALDPGTPAGGKVPDGGMLPITQTEPDVLPDQFLAALDADTRDYLKLLLQAAGSALGTDADGRPAPGQVSSLRSTLRRFAPLARDSRRLGAALAARKHALRGAVHSFGQVSQELGRVDNLVADWVASSNQSLKVFADQDGDVRSALDAFPPALKATRRALSSSTGLANQVDVISRRLQPFARSLAPALLATQDLSRSTTALLRDRIRPAVRATRPTVRQIAPGVASLSRVTPSTVRTFDVLRDLFQALSYNPPGGEEGYLFWGSWLSHIGASLTSIQDANGPMGRSLTLLTCPQLDAVAQIEAGNPTLNALLSFSNIPDRFKLCPNEVQAEATPDPSAAPGGTR